MPSRAFVATVVALLLAVPQTAWSQNDDGLTFRDVLYFANRFSSIDGPTDAALSPDGTDVYVAFPETDEVAHFARDEESGTLVFVEFTEVYNAEIEDPVSAFQLTVTPNGRHVFAITSVAAAPGIVRFARNTRTGDLTVGEFTMTGEGDLADISQITSIVVAPSGQYLYANGRNTSAEFESVLTFELDSSSGELTLIDRDDRLPDYPQSMFFLPFGPMTVSPDGLNLYVAGATQGGVEIYTIAQDTGQVSFFRVEPTAVTAPDNVRRVNISADGRQAFVAESLLEGNLIVLERDPATGDLTAPPLTTRGTTANIPMPGIVHVSSSPDGARVYTLSVGALGGGPILLTAFDRDPETGALTEIETFQDGLYGLSVLQGQPPITVSPDSLHLYTPSVSGDSLAIFAVERPNLPCEDGNTISVEYSTLANVYDLYEDIDLDGLPELAAIALIEEASCDNDNDSFDDAVTNAYLINIAAAKREAAADAVWVSFQRGIAGLHLISADIGAYLNEAFAEFDIELAEPYLAVSCTGDVCEPVEARAGRAADEPFSGAGDPDADGFTNAEEWANVLARGGDERDFAASALDPTNDGSRGSGGGGGGGGCFIATAAYGTPLANELDTLRDFRDTRLLTNPLGTAFADAYYRLSPPVADFMADRPWLRGVVRFAIKPFHQ